MIYMSTISDILSVDFQKIILYAIPTAMTMYVLLVKVMQYFYMSKLNNFLFNTNYFHIEHNRKYLEKKKVEQHQ